MYHIPILVPARRVTELLETTKASAEHPAAFTESVLQNGQKGLGHQLSLHGAKSEFNPFGIGGGYCGTRCLLHSRGVHWFCLLVCRSLAC